MRYHVIMTYSCEAETEEEAFAMARNAASMGHVWVEFQGEGPNYTVLLLGERDGAELMGDKWQS